MKTFALTLRKYHLATAAIFALCCPMLAAAAAKGTVTYKGQSWNVADAIAYDSLGLTLAFSKLPWDRAAWAEDGEFDRFDIYKLEGGASELHLEVEINADGEYRRHSMVKEFGLGEDSSRAAGKGLTLQSTGPERMQGSFKWADDTYAIDISFDLPVLKTGSALPFPGSPLPGDGGAPGKAMLATLAATAAGNIDQMLALSSPEKRALMKAAFEKPDFAKLLAMQKAFTPTAVQISGGSQLDDRAWLSFSGLKDGKAMRGSAFMQRIDGQWYVSSVKTKL